MQKKEDKCGDNTGGRISDGNRFTGRERFNRAVRCQPVDYPPVWMMRQAGRALPEYRALKEKYTFNELIKTPELAAEVTLQPIRRFDFDAAIIFSDILVVPEAMGQPFYFTEKNGVKMEFAISTYDDILRLNPSRASDKLTYVCDAIKIVRKSLGDKTALIGFSGSPWTIANFMLEGGSAIQFEKAKEMFVNERKLFELLMEKLTEAIIQYLENQIIAGVDAVQIFDTLGGILSKEEFASASAVWMKEIVHKLNGRAPVIVFSKDVHNNWNDLISTGANVIGIDHNFPLSEARRIFPLNVAIQGNLNPELLRLQSPQPAIDETKKILSEMNGRNGYIFNLGHGVPPDARLEIIEEILKIIRKV